MKKKELKSVVIEIIEKVNSIDKRLNELEQYATPEELNLLEHKPKELVVGKWYKGNYYDTKYLVFPTELHNETVVEGYGFCDDGSWSVFNNDAGVGKNTRLAFSNEVESALITEANRLGHKYDAYSWNHEQNTLYGNRGNDVGHDILFENGVWSEVKPEEKPKIGDVVKAWVDYENDYIVGVLVGFTDFHNDFIIRTGSHKYNDYISRYAKKITPQEAIDLLFNK